MRNRLKEITIGFMMGLIANSFGVLVCLFVVSRIKGISLTGAFSFYMESGTSWTILTLGALPNLLAFFGFLKINREYRARGVMIATFLAAIMAYIIYFT